MYSPKVSIYDGVKDNIGKTVSIEAVIKRIKSGARGLDATTRSLNALSQTEPQKYDKEKIKLPAVTFSGTFPPYKRKAQHLLAHSAHITLDIDGLPPGQIADLLAELAQMPHVVLAFVSPSGAGIKVIVHVDPIPHNDHEHKGAYQACLEFFDNLAIEYGFKIDTSGKDCSRLCFLAHEHHPIVNTTAPAIPWNREAYLKAEKEKHVRFEADAKKPYTGNVDIKALDYIDPNDLDYNQWLSVITAGKAAKLSWQQVDAWSQRGGIRYTEGEVETRWDGLNLDVSWGAVVNLAKLNGYTPPQREKRYTINTEYKHTTSDMDTERDGNKNDVVEWLQKTENLKGNHALILGRAAGTGKTTAAIFETEKLLYIAKSSKEADEVFESLNENGEDALRHRARMYNRDHPDWNTLPLGLGENERPCIEPEICDTHSNILGTPNENCRRCPAYTSCKENAYLSQAQKEKNTKKVVYAWNEVMICDKTYKNRVKQVCSAEDVVIQDEANPLAFTQKRSISREMLYDLTERFRHPHAETTEIYRTLKALLDHLSTAETPEPFIDGIQEWIDSIDDIKELDEKLEKYPVSVVFQETAETAIHDQPFEATICYQNEEVTVPVVDFETADDTPAYWIDPNTPITPNHYEIRFMSYSFLLKVGLATLEDPPRRHRDILIDLKTFLDENHTLAAAPFRFDPKEQSFEFHLKPTLNHRRVIINTASDPDNLIGEAYRETDVSITRCDGTPPLLKTDLVFQISSGAYLPRQSLIAKDGKKLSLKKYPEKMIDTFIQPSVEAGLKTLVVAPKAFQEVESVKKWAVTDPDDYIPGKNAILTNHHRAEGINDYQDCDIVFTFHYEPNHHEIQADAKHIYRNPEKPLNFAREKQTVSVKGVEFEKNVYIDNRVQAVYNRECRARLMQGSMRLRPNIHKDKILVYLTAEPVDIPVTPVPFTPADKDKFKGDWADFKKKLQATPKERIAAGESKSKAYRNNNTHKQEKADRDTEIIRRHSEGASQREIYRQMKEAGYKISLGTVNSVLTAFRNSQSTIISTYSRMGKTEHPPTLDDTCVESEILHTCEPEPDHDTFFKFMDISTCFYGKHQVSPSEVSQLTGIDESEVRRILDNWYRDVVISPGIGEKYWMTERDKKNLCDKVLAPMFTEWGQNFPGQKILCPPTLFNPNLNANASER